ncbi:MULTISPECIES: AbrB/MazE/SpoVT family DNA-binding domain-containing protein [unclassified Candidatus Tisiphia]|jgi:AbrB family looped-hinge helix DNA binding protein|uniref:AbrB/MazE/SpoVT family DNA-binding domain-containing protein n=1 Tax=unclassified Candidatus Tisiphia TaxID=2996318 RepID=UPI001E77F120|nr:MAG: AbrB/MazE/SpoVT family DNA-binding domain-containing protein [Rickettsia endosymbiont of Cimex lectularius]
MKISSKGQITIPIDIRSKFGFLPDTEITFIEKEDGVLLKKYQNQNDRGNKLILHMSGKSTVKMSTDTIMKLTRS